MQFVTIEDRLDNEVRILVKIFRATNADVRRRHILDTMAERKSDGIRVGSLLELSYSFTASDRTADSGDDAERPIDRWSRYPGAGVDGICRDSVLIDE